MKFIFIVLLSSGCLFFGSDPSSANSDINKDVGTDESILDLKQPIADLGKIDQSKDDVGCGTV